MSRRYLKTCLTIGCVLAVCVSASPQMERRDQPPGTKQQRTPIDAVESQGVVEVAIERELVFGSILVNARVNQKEAVLVLDTGSNTTILSPEILDVSLTKLRRADPRAKGSGFVGQGRWAMVSLEVGTTVWRDRRVLASDMREVSRAYHRKVDGLLGVDVLSEFKQIEIDFEHRRLIFNEHHDPS